MQIKFSNCIMNSVFVWKKVSKLHAEMLLPVSIAERSKARTVYDRLKIGISGSNPTWGMDVCPRVSVLYCPVSVEALCRADPPAKESNKCLYM
jgi:hypothetical protein